jgi:transcription antitermination factor NusG
MTKITSSKEWYAVYTKSRCEKKVVAHLNQKKIENYCPLTKIQKKWSDRKKIILEPIFKSYVFVHISILEDLEIRKTPGVINFVYWLNKPAIIKTHEIEILKRFLNDYSDINISKIPIKINDSVQIVSGPLMELDGKVISVGKNSVKVILPSLGYEMSAEISKANIKIIKENNSTISEIKDAPSSQNGRAYYYP